MTGTNTRIKTAVKLFILAVLILSLTSCEAIMGIFGIPNASGSTQLVKDSSTASKQVVFNRSTESRAADPGTWITPDNISGKVISVFLIVGVEDENGDGEGSAVWLMLHDRYNPVGFMDSYVQAGADYLYDFDFSEPDLVPVSIVANPFMYPPDERAYTAEVNTLFAWMDISFSTAGLGFGLAGDDHTIRMYMADVDTNNDGVISGSEPHGGDILYVEADGTAYWVTDTYQLSASRPASPVQDEAVANYRDNPSDEGNQYIEVVSADIADDARERLTFTDLTTHTWQYDVVFDMFETIVFYPDRINGSTTADITSKGELVKCFNIPLWSRDGEGISAWVETTPLN